MQKLLLLLKMRLSFALEMTKSSSRAQSDFRYGRIGQGWILGVGCDVEGDRRVARGLGGGDKSLPTPTLAGNILFCKGFWCFFEICPHSQSKIPLQTLSKPPPNPLKTPLQTPHPLKIVATSLVGVNARFLFSFDLKTAGGFSQSRERLSVIWIFAIFQMINGFEIFKYKFKFLTGF